MPVYARVNSFGLLVAYSNDSSHMLLGAAQNRKILNIGASYSRRLLFNRVVNWQYDAELLPVALESDPVQHVVYQQTSPVVVTSASDYREYGACVAGTDTFNVTINGVVYAGTVTATCKREWTMGEAMSPIGMRWNFLPRHKIQPFLGGHGGTMYSTQVIPIEYAGAFNFTFDFDAGVEFYRSARKSVRVEYRYHHISNHNTATQNPGVDNGVFQVAYVFGR